MSAPTARRRRHRGPDHTVPPGAGRHRRPGHGRRPRPRDGPRHRSPSTPTSSWGFRSLDPGSHPFDVGRRLRGAGGLGGVRPSHHWSSTPPRRPYPRHCAGWRAPSWSIVAAARHRCSASTTRCCDRPALPRAPSRTSANACSGCPRQPRHAPPPRLWIAVWLDRLVDQRPEDDRLSTWAQLAGLHPAVRHRRRPAPCLSPTRHRSRRSHEGTPRAPPGTTSVTPPPAATSRRSAPCRHRPLDGRRLLRPMDHRRVPPAARHRDDAARSLQDASRAAARRVGPRHPRGIATIGRAGQPRALLDRSVT